MRVRCEEMSASDYEEYRLVAPEPARLVQLFVNSTDLADGRDELATSGGLARWLIENGLAVEPVPVSAAELRHAVELRESIRCLLIANASSTTSVVANERLNRLAAPHQLRVSVDPTGAIRLTPRSTGVRGAMARILSALAESAAVGDLNRLKPCASPTCRWVYYDYSRNRSRAWCSMRTCGSPAKSRAYRQRRRRSVASSNVPSSG